MNWKARDIMNRLASSSSLLQEVSEQDLHNLKAVLLNMMQDIHNVCMHRNIRYSLLGGSMLGAIRHQGFIPWDDDIDIVMPREDWERFKDIFQTDMGGKYVLEAPGYGDKDTKTFFGKVYLKGTTLLELQDLSSPFEKGIWIDIFVLENVSDSPLVRWFDGLVSDCWRIVSTCQQYYRYPNELMDAYMGATPASKWYYRARKFVGFCFSFISHKRFVALYDRFVSRHKKTRTYVTVPASRKFYRGEILPATVFMPFHLVKFEDRQFLSMADPHAYCRNLYGDTYMQEPPPEKRERHFFVKLDFGDALKP